MRSASTGGRVVGCAAIAIAALALAACGSDDPEPAAAVTDSAAASAAAPAKEGKLPKALAANQAQAGQILDEGSLDGKLAELEGHPVVVNQWASWCDPCRAEFPYLAAAADEHAGEVAFVGIDMQDSRSAAEQFLAESPVPYPHIDDPSAAQIASLGGGVVSPTTVFIDEQGEVVHVYQGAYAGREQLEQDIERYLLG